MILIYFQILWRFVKGLLVLPSKNVVLQSTILVFFCTSNLFGFNSENFTNDFFENDLATVSGIVTDETGETLIGVSILIKDSDQGTTTDVDGRYSIDMPDGLNTLVFSYTGFKTVEVNVDGRTNIDVVLQSSSQILDELVVIGYGTVKKSDLTGSVASISGAELTSIASGNPTSTLQGKISGLPIL